MKLDSIMTIVGVLSLVGRMHATMVVHDPVLMAKQSADEVVNFAKWAKTEVDAAATQLNTLQTYENTVLQVVRIGNPAALRNLPVVGSIAALAGTGQQLLADYQRIRAMANPQYLQGELGSVVNAYRLQNWTPLAPGAYQFAAANWQVSQTIQDQMADLGRLPIMRDDQFLSRKPKKMHKPIAFYFFFIAMFLAWAHGFLESIDIFKSENQSPWKTLLASLGVGSYLTLMCIMLVFAVYSIATSRF